MSEKDYNERDRRRPDNDSEKLDVMYDMLWETKLKFTEHTGQLQSHVEQFGRHEKRILDVEKKTETCETRQSEQRGMTKLVKIMMAVVGAVVMFRDVIPFVAAIFHISLPTFK